MAARMNHRFTGFEIDEARRELRAGDRVLSLQPKVFDLLAYLARHSDRVVPKGELLEAIWPGVIVTDASLQRAISLARSALSEVGVADAIRTHARQGYRLHMDAASVADGALDAASRAALIRAREAYARGGWEDAVAAFREVDRLEGLAADDLQRWAHASQCVGRPDEALPVLERAVAAFSAGGDPRRAAWAAILSAHLRTEWGEFPLANGWVHRAARLLEGQPPGREQGYVELLKARLALLRQQLEDSLAHALRACEAGRAFSDPDLESLGLVHAGEAWLYLGQIRKGLNAIDEAGASVVASGLSPWAGGLVYCGVIYSCMTRADWQRAAQWTEQFTRWCEDKGAPAYPGLCRMHRAEVLTVKGELGEAESEIQATIGMLKAHAPWAHGDAWRVLGDIFLARGAFADARAAFVRAAELGWDTTFKLALVRFYEGDAAGAARLLARSMDENAWSCRSQHGLALAYLVIMAAAAGEVGQARAALDKLGSEPDLASTPALRALLARARGEFLAVEGDRTGAIRELRSSLRMWQAIGAPLPGAEVRRSLAGLLIAAGDPESAGIELAAAMNIFRQAGAEGQLRRCESLRAGIGAARIQSGA
jgi:DNA-binding winged helix-turn-helix (wHTH) protein